MLQTHFLVLAAHQGPQEHHAHPNPGLNHPGPTPKKLPKRSFNNTTALQVISNHITTCLNQNKPVDRTRFSSNVSPLTPQGVIDEINYREGLKANHTKSVEETIVAAAGSQPSHSDPSPQNQLREDPPPENQINTGTAQVGTKHFSQQLLGKN